MTAGETLLKVTDFPFSYTIIAIAFVVLDINFDDRKIIILLAIAGSLGTLLSVTNPVGRLLKYWLKRNIENGRQKKYFSLFSKIPYSLRAVETRAIGIEIDKLVSMWYFGVVMFALSLLFVYSEGFVEKLELKTNDGSTFCDSDCVQLVGVIVTSVVLIILAAVANRDWKDLIKFLDSAAIHQSAINSKNAERSTIENLIKAIELNDWPTAEEWATKTEEEILEQKGRKDSILKLIEVVYQPLFREILDLLEKHDQIISSQWYAELPSGVWRDIKTSDRYFAINDEKFVKMMDDFRYLVDEYNDLVKYTFDKAREIINKEATNFYKKNVSQISYVYRTEEGAQSSPTLANCLIWNTHPKDDKRVKPNPILHIQLSITESGVTKSEILETKQDFKVFDQLWEKMVSAFNSDLKCKKIKEDFAEISSKKNIVLEEVIEKLKQQKKFY